MVLEKNIFYSKTEDFFKIIFATILCFILSFNNSFLNSDLTLFIIVYVLDAGHVYSTFAEVLLDPDEFRKPYVYKVIAFSFTINYLILNFDQSYFYLFIFYFTIFHNMRQGLGLVFLCQMSDQRQRLFYKISYYFLTMLPFFLFHFRDRDAHPVLGEAILKPLIVSHFISPDMIKLIYQVGLGTYILGCIFILTAAMFQKQYQALKIAIFFSIIYGYAFVFSQNEFQSYMLLIVSHAVPYYFLMNLRIEKTHSLYFFRKNAPWILALIFIFGGFFEYNHDSIYKVIPTFQKVLMALLTTPLIAHFIFDALIWKKNNKRFQIFKQRFVEK